MEPYHKELEDLKRQIVNLKTDINDLQKENDELGEEVDNLEGELFDNEINQDFVLPHDNLADELKAKFLLEQFDKYTEDELRNLLTK